MKHVEPMEGQLPLFDETDVVKPTLRWREIPKVSSIGRTGKRPESMIADVKEIKGAMSHLFQYIGPNHEAREILVGARQCATRLDKYARAMLEMEDVLKGNIEYLQAEVTALITKDRR